MQVTPRTEQQIIEENLWADGEYSFEIATAEEKLSQKGNEMIEMKVNVYNNEGRSQSLFDYLMDSMAFKLRHCCEATGLLDAYESGSLSAYDLQGKTGTLKLYTKKAENGYPPKNAIADYVVDKNARTESKPKKAASPSFAADEVDDEIPF